MPRGGGAEGLGPRMVGRQQQVAAEQLVRLARDGALDAIGEEADAGQRRHGQHQRDGQHGQFAGTQVARQHAQGEAPGLHGASSRASSPPRSQDSNSAAGNGRVK